MSDNPGTINFTNPLFLSSLVVTLPSDCVSPQPPIRALSEDIATVNNQNFVQLVSVSESVEENRSTEVLSSFSSLSTYYLPLPPGNADHISSDALDFARKPGSPGAMKGREKEKPHDKKGPAGKGPPPPEEEKETEIVNLAAICFSQ